MNQILAIVAWWLSLEVIGLVAWPLTAAFFGATASRGAAFIKHLGLLVTGFLLWMLVTFKVLENTRVAVLLVVLLVAAASLILTRRQRLVDLWRAQRRDLLAAEIVFLVAFLAYLAFRAYDPGINHTEKPMDFGFLNAILRSPTFPPNDMWFSGYSISYYYFGYLLMAAVTRLSGVPSAIGYNLALGTVFALAVTGAFGLVRDLVAGVRRSRTAGIGYGLLGAAFVAIAGNLEGFLEYLHASGYGSAAFWQWINIPALTQAQVPQPPSWLPGMDWWWWRATRLIQDTNVLGKMPEVIAEFPAFSYVLGDLHPHVMALPFGLLAIAAAWNLLLATPQLPEGEGVPLWRGWHITWPALPPFAWLLPVLIGALGFMNSWDFPTYALLAVVAYGIGRAWRYGKLTWAWVSETVGMAVLVLAGGFALYLPFYIGFRSQASGLKVVNYAKTPWLQYALIFGLFLCVLLPWLIGQGWAARRRLHFWVALGVLLLAVPALAIGLMLAGGGLGGILVAPFIANVTGPGLAIALGVLIALAGAILWLRLRPGEETPQPGATFAVLLTLTGLLLTFGTEFVFVGDSFGTRMNTVFKLYYQAWLLLAVAAAWGVSEIVRRLRDKRSPVAGVWLGAVALLFVASLYFPVAAAFSKAGGFAGRATLDGTAWVDPNAGEGAAIGWLNKQVKGTAVILEAPGDAYNPSHDRVSAWTGLPTVLGWANHEDQWGRDDSEVARRASDVAAIYQARDANTARTLLAKYNVQYVYVGPYERSKYTITRSNLSVLEQVAAKVYDKDGVVIYQMK